MYNKKVPRVLVIPSFYPMDMNYPRGNFFREQSELINIHGGNLEILYNEDRSISDISFGKLRRFHFQNTYGYENNLFVIRKHNWNIIPTRTKLGQKYWINQSIKLYEEYVSLRGKPDLIHVHCALFGGFVAKKIKEIYGVPYIITEHSTFFATSNIENEFKNKLSEIYNNASKIITVSEPFKRLLTSKVSDINNDIHIVPNFIDTNFFDPKLSVLQIDPSVVTFFCTCYHEPKKNLSRLIQAFKLVYENNKDIRLIVGGEGSQSQHLKNMVTEYELNNVISFPGFLNREQVRSYLSISNAFVLTSDYETFGVVLIEAMAMGLPVITTNSGGPESFVNEEVGYICEKNYIDVADKMKRYISNRFMFNKDKIRNFILENFSSENVSKNYIKIYHSVL